MCVHEKKVREVSSMVCCDTRELDPHALTRINKRTTTGGLSVARGGSK